MGKPKRIDGVGYLTKEQKAERDARAQYWMNQRKIERVAEGAARHGWYSFAGEWVDELIDDGTSRVDDDGELVIVTHEGEYRVEGYRPENDTYVLRKLLSKEITVGGNEE